MSDPKISSNFRASEEVLLLLEGAKKQLDHSIDMLPGIYFVIDELGQIYRSNFDLQKLIGVGPLAKKSCNVFDLMGQQDATHLAQVMANAIKYPGENYSLEVDLKSIENEVLSYSLSFYSWRTNSQSIRQFFTFHGKDVSQLKKISHEKELLVRELSMAEEVQKLMLPEAHQTFSKGEVSCFYQSASECGGDFLLYDVQEDHVKIWTGDVTGHGVGPAMISGAIRAAISMMESDDKVLKPLEAMTRLNQTLYAIAKGQYWMTFQIAYFDFKTNKLEICQAGHTDVFTVSEQEISHGDWRSFAALDVGATPPLGKSVSSQFVAKEFDLKDNQLYLSCSDGLYETKRADGVEFGQRRLLKGHMDSYKVSKSLKAAQESLRQSIAEFREFGPLDDDLSFWSLLTSL